VVSTLPAASVALVVGKLAGQPLDVFIAGDGGGAKQTVAELARAGGLNPIDAGPLRRARELEDSLPPYDVLDPILEAYVERDESPAQIAGNGVSEELVTDVIRMVDRAEYKRRQAPPGIKITPKAFGRDRRLPITNRFSG